MNSSPNYCLFIDCLKMFEIELTTAQNVLKVMSWKWYELTFFIGCHMLEEVRRLSYHVHRLSITCDRWLPRFHAGACCTISWMAGELFRFRHTSVSSLRLANYRKQTFSANGRQQFLNIAFCSNLACQQRLRKSCGPTASTAYFADNSSGMTL